jgi:predicted ATPase
VLGASSDLAGELVQHCPGVTVLATSRQPLHSVGERRWPVGALLVDTDAVALFIDRALAVRPDLVVDDADLELVEEACRRLDGMPLAIELAAARLQSMSIKELAERLDERLRLLHTNVPSDDGRHSSLVNVLEWSYGLLSAPERQLFNRLAVFAGGFDQAAAHAVCVEVDRDDLDTLDIIDSLVDKSLVQVSTQDRLTRYSLLESMRHYGIKKWTPSERSSLRRCHAHYYAALAAQSMDGMASPDDVAWVDWFDRELDNLRAAFNWSIAAGDHATAVSIPANLVYYAYTLPSEVWAWAERAATLSDLETNRRRAASSTTWRGCVTSWVTPKEPSTTPRQLWPSRGRRTCHRTPTCGSYVPADRGGSAMWPKGGDGSGKPRASPHASALAVFWTSSSPCKWRPMDRGWWENRRTRPLSGPSPLRHRRETNEPACSPPQPLARPSWRWTRNAPLRCSPKSQCWRRA